MLLRLAYSIAIQVPFDILLLDEVLAVGDERFQQKCFDTFEEIRDQREDGRPREPATRHRSRDSATAPSTSRTGGSKRIGPAAEVVDEYRERVAGADRLASVK